MRESEKARAWDILVARLEGQINFKGNWSQNEPLRKMVAEAKEKAMATESMTMRERLALEVKQTSYRATARRLGMDHRTVWNIVNGVSDNPTMRTVEKINKAMEEQHE